MKKRICVLGVLLMLASVAGAQTYVFEKEIAVYPLPTALAADSSGGIYYATFADVNSAVYYIPDPINQNTTTTQLLVLTESSFPASRGFQSAAVDSTDRFYVCGDNGTNGVFKRVTKSGSVFTVDSTFVPANAASTRLTGVAVVGSLVVASGLLSGELYFYNNDGSINVTVTGVLNYPRDVAYNPANNDIYVSRNGNAACLELFSGGSPSTPSGYSLATSSLIADGGTPLLGAHGIYYDSTNLNLVLPNRDTPEKFRIYGVSGTGASTVLTPKQEIDGTDSTGGQITDAVDAVVIGPRLYLTDFGGNRLLVYNSASSVRDWSLFE
ncbi:MAG: hypothetical protein V2A74_14070 [bacterium]